MTSTLAQGVDRSPAESRSVPSVRSPSSPALIVLLLGGLALRLTIAYVLFPSSGFESDIGSYASWALTLGEHGPAGFYANAGFSDYPPAYLYVLWPVGLLASAARMRLAAGGELVKLPAILLDIAVGYVIYRLVLGWTWPGPRAETTGPGRCCAVSSSTRSPSTTRRCGARPTRPAPWWCCWASLHSIRGNSEGAAALAATAAVVKPQFGVVLIPLVAFVLRQAPPAATRHRAHATAPGRRRRCAAGLSAEQGWPRLVTAFAAAWVAFFVLALPFGMGPSSTSSA